MDRNLLAALYLDHINDLQRRYQPLVVAAQFDMVVIHSGSLKKRTEFDDQFFAMRAVPHFQHWLPLAQPDCAVVLGPGNARKLLWYQSQSYWERPAPMEFDHWQSQWEIVRIAQPEDVKDHLPAGQRIAFIGEDRARAASWGLTDDAQNPPDLVGRLDRLRVFKTPYEILCIAEANRRAALGHDAVLDAFRNGDASELALHLRYLQATLQDDPETPYKNIVALGKNSATLHHISYEKHAISKDCQSLLLDAGATFQGYTSDITRTWYKGQGATISAFSGLVSGMEALQLRLCDKVAVGLGYEQLHEQAHVGVAAILRDIGVLKYAVADEVQKKISTTFFPHGLGHSLGLQCHDVGCALVKPKPENPYLRNTSTIEPGQVFTIEPGIYFIDFLLDEMRASDHNQAINWPLVEALSDLGGVRIEDDLVVKNAQDGQSAVDNLTRPHLPLGGGG